MKCNKCNGKFAPPENFVISNCPFCQAPLQDKSNKSNTKNIPPNSYEWKILEIIKVKGEDIYTKKEFIGLILDYFPNDDFGRLIKTVIEKKGALYVSKLKQYSGNELQIKYTQLIAKLSKETFIASDVLTPAVDLLCFGLGLKIQSTIVRKPAQQQVKKPAPNRLNLNDFNIVNGVLIEYFGKGGKVTIPNSVTTIREFAFSGCEKLTSITIPNSVTTIEGSAFFKCKNLSSINSGNSVAFIGDWAFAICENLTAVTIPNSVTFIGERAFSECTNLISVTIPSSVTSIGNYAFTECVNLITVNLYASNADIGACAFFRCINLEQSTKSKLNQLGYNNNF